MAPFVAAGVLPFVLLPFADVSLSDPRVLGAAAIALAIIVLALEVPWPRLPAWPQAIPPLAYFVLVALLRDASGGSPSIFDSLVLVPVSWFAIYGTGAELAVSILGLGATLIVPAVIIGPPAYDTQAARAGERGVDRSPRSSDRRFTR